MPKGGSRQPRQVSSLPTLAALTLFTGTMFAVPLLIHRRHMRLNNQTPLATSDKPLSAAQVRRGAYLNTGSKDVGLDPDFDPKAGTYKGRKAQIADASAGGDQGGVWSR
mmetsp:Transcript_35233/g.105294  ORF Transcript_35233/g.105294 Transcript_35233/m.105294 type:complete len:109 (-) Transcript_35233:330-656(-)